MDVLVIILDVLYLINNTAIAVTQSESTSIAT